MNVKDYIESGILEAYVLGALSEDERAEVAENINQYPKLAAEVAAIEAAMERYAELNAIAPPKNLEEDIWAIISKDIPVSKPANDTSDGVFKDKSIPLPASHEVNWQRAAIWVFLVGSLLANILLLSQRNESKQEIAALSQKVDVLQLQSSNLTALADQYNKGREMMADTGMQTIIMHTVQKGHPMAATMYWQKSTGTAYISVDKLPMPPKGMQYQMWVIQNGKPVDMGVIANEVVAKSGMNKVAINVADGQAFAISLEKEGGSPTPTMENIYVLGKVAS